MAEQPIRNTVARAFDSRTGHGGQSPNRAKGQPAMKLRTIAASAALVIASAGTTAALTSGTPAHASGTVTETVTQTNVMISALCYKETKITVRYYSHHAHKGWVALPAPSYTFATSTHCYAS